MDFSPSEDISIGVMLRIVELNFLTLHKDCFICQGYQGYQNRLKMVQG